MKPGYPTTDYEDADIFLPYSELNLRKGDWNLKLDIDLSYEDGESDSASRLQELSSLRRRPSLPNPPKRPDISATVNRVWVDYDVIENRRKGMRIHVNFEVVGTERR